MAREFDHSQATRQVPPGACFTFEHRLTLETNDPRLGCRRFTRTHRSPDLAGGGRHRL